MKGRFDGGIELKKVKKKRKGVYRERQGKGKR